MLWRKSERFIGPNCKKILLHRKRFGGKVELRKFVQKELPPANGHPIGTIYCLTRRRFFWRFRLWMPLQSTYFTLKPNGRWVQMCRTFH